MTDLNELLERVKKATGPDRELDRDICIALQYGGKNSEGATNVRIDPEWGDDNDLIFEIGPEECCNPIPELTSSIDAALALVEFILPAGWPDVLREAISELSRRHSWHITFPVSGQRKELPIAICGALLSALISKESSNDQ